MPVSNINQFFVFDPGNPPAVGTALTPCYLKVTGGNKGGFINGSSKDSIDGKRITATWPGDEITVAMGGKRITISGCSIYLADGSAVFTPSDGTVLSAATYKSSTYVTSQGLMPAESLGPPCFALGTTILTSTGSRKIEDLSAGDLVETVDRGLCPIRYVGGSKTAGKGDFAPVLFREGAIGNINDLRVAPQHRVLINGQWAQQVFGRDEVLVPAKHLVDGKSVVREEAGTVEYFHILFDEHELIFSDGAVTESYFPGGQILQDRHVRTELLDIVSEFDEGRRAGMLQVA